MSLDPKMFEAMVKSLSVVEEKLRAIEALSQKLHNAQRELEDEPMSLDRFCVFADISRSQAYKLTHRGELSFFRPNGKMIYILKSEALKYILRNKVKSREELEREANEKYDSGDAFISKKSNHLQSPEL